MPDKRTISVYGLKGTTEKIVLVALWLLIAVGITNWLTQVMLLLTGLLFIRLTGICRTNQWKLILFGASFIFAGTLGLIFETGERAPIAYLQFHMMGVWWNITTQSLAKAITTALKAMNGLLAIQVAIGSLSFAEGMTLARRIHLPEVFIELMVLSYRYLFGVKKCACEVLVAQRQRLGYSGVRTGLKSFANMLSAVFIKSVRLSLQNYQAMQVRAYHGRTYCPEYWQTSSISRIILITIIALCYSATSLIKV